MNTAPGVRTIEKAHRPKIIMAQILSMKLSISAFLLNFVTTIRASGRNAAARGVVRTMPDQETSVTESALNNNPPISDALKLAAFSVYTQFAQNPFMVPTHDLTSEESSQPSASPNESVRLSIAQSALARSSSHTRCPCPCSNSQAISLPCAFKTCQPGPLRFCFTVNILSPLCSCVCKVRGRSRPRATRRRSLGGPPRTTDPGRRSATPLRRTAT